MGLDTYAARTPDEELSDDDIEAFEKADINFCGGVVSGLRLLLLSLASCMHS